MCNRTIFHNAFTCLSLTLLAGCQLPNDPSSPLASDTDFTHLTHGAPLRDNIATSAMTPGDEYVHVRFARSKRNYFEKEELRLKGSANIRAYQKNGCPANEPPGDSLLILLDGSLGNRDQQTQRLCIWGDVTWFDRLREVGTEVTIVLPADTVSVTQDLWTVLEKQLVFVDRTNPARTIDLSKPAQPKN
jgi:hypothetical protein